MAVTSWASVSSLPTNRDVAFPLAIIDRWQPSQSPHTKSYSSANRWKGTTQHLIISSTVFLSFPAWQTPSCFSSSSIWWQELGLKPTNTHFFSLLFFSSNTPADQTQLRVIFVRSGNPSVFRSLGVNHQLQSIFCSPTWGLSIVISHPEVRGGRQRL